MSDEKIIINAPKPKKKISKLRVIDQGNNRYDVPGKLIQLARAIRDGKYGDVTDVIVGVREIRIGGGIGVTAYHFGRGDSTVASHTVELTKRAMGE